MAAEIKALFVTEDEQDHSNIERLFTMSRGFSTQFVVTCNQARSALALGGFDVLAAVVGDEQSEGFRALSVAGELHPGVARLALTSRDSTDAGDVSHQTLGRPWDGRKVRIGLLSAVYLGEAGRSSDLIERAST